MIRFRSPYTCFSNISVLSKLSPVFLLFVYISILGAFAISEENLSGICFDFTRFVLIGACWSSCLVINLYQVDKSSSISDSLREN